MGTECEDRTSEDSSGVGLCAAVKEELGKDVLLKGTLVVAPVRFHAVPLTSGSHLSPSSSVSLKPLSLRALWMGFRELVRHKFETTE